MNLGPKNVGSSHPCNGQNFMGENWCSWLAMSVGISIQPWIFYWHASKDIPAQHFLASQPVFLVHTGVDIIDPSEKDPMITWYLLNSLVRLVT